MDQNEKTNKKLFNEFPQVSTETWKEKIIKDLKGADYERKLVWKTREGFDVQPFYRQEDLQGLENLDVYPGDFPFVRGSKTNSNEWYIRQDIKVEDIKKANKKALDVLMKGVTSLGFDLKNNKPSEKDIEDLLENIFADSVELNYKAGDYSLEVVGIIESLVNKYNRDFKKIEGSVDYDPIGYLLLHGNFRKEEKQVFEHAAELMKKSKYLPRFRVITVDGSIYKNAGATIVEELAFTLSHANEYLSRLTDLNLNINELAPKIKFNMAIGSDYFMEIAKLRAARMLWANIVNAYGPDTADVTRMYIHSETADWNKTLYDSYVNMLRTTTEAMSAAIAGSDSLLVKGFNSIYEDTTDFSERIARNQQLLLKEESYFDKVVDPSAGSYYIENLTQSIANEAWKLFLEIDEKGGFLQALKDGLIQNKIKESTQQRDMAIAKRKEILLGTNQYPGFQERIERKIDEEILNPKDLTADDAIIETLKPYRGAQAFERLRYQTDKYSLNNKRPIAFMLTYGNLAMRRARAQFSSNFFACAGYEVVDNNGFKTVEDGLNAAREMKADIIVLCSSDEEYAEIAPKANELRNDDEIIVVAGYPKEIIDELQSKGIKHFIHMKSNVLETLQGFQKEMNIA